jgi:hypothetical protein
MLKYVLLILKNIQNLLNSILNQTILLNTYGLIQLFI